MISLTTLDVTNLLIGNKSEKTVRSYSHHWQRYLEFSSSYGDPREADTLAGWRQHLIKETLESANTINLRLHAVKAIFRELAQRKLVAREIYWAINDVKGLKPNALPKRRRPNARVKIEPHQMRGLVETPNIQLGDPAGTRDRALLLVLATSGVRISEAIRIRVEDIQVMEENYFIANVIGKGQAEPRISPLSKEAYLAIQDWLHVRPTHSEWLFTSIYYTDQEGLLYSNDPISRSSAYHIVKKMAGQYGMPEVKPHDFRRFVGTQLAKDDIRKAQRVLGHVSIDTTAKSYIMDEVPLGSTEGLF